MNKAEEFIKKESHIIENPTSMWISSCNARKAVEIAREETLKEVKKKLLNMLQVSVDNQHFFEKLDEYIDELENKQYKMSKEEWINVLNSAYNKAERDYNCAKYRTPEEYMARLCMNIFDYLSNAIKESNEE